jgi:hypothetical protein
MNANASEYNYFAIDIIDREWRDEGKKEAKKEAKSSKLKLSRCLDPRAAE